MTVEERDRVKTKTFDELWDSLWGGTAGFQYRGEEKTSRDKYDSLKNGIMSGGVSFSLSDLLAEADSKWNETEWASPRVGGTIRRRIWPAVSVSLRRRQDIPRLRCQSFRMCYHMTKYSLGPITNATNTDIMWDL